MKFSLLFLATALTEDAPVDERKKSKGCTVSLPKTCTECLYVRNMGKGADKSAALEHCRQKGWHVDMSPDELVKCQDTGTVCAMRHPSTCEDCEAMGDKCVKSTGSNKLCKSMGYKKGHCKKNMQCMMPTQCNQCRQFSSEKKCAKKQKKSCRKMSC